MKTHHGVVRVVIFAFRKILQPSVEVVADLEADADEHLEEVDCRAPDFLDGLFPFSLRALSDKRERA